MTRFQSRKQLRKQQRKEKKIRKNEYYTNRDKPGKYVRNPDTQQETKPSDLKKKKTTQQKHKNVINFTGFLVKYLCFLKLDCR